MLTIIQDLLDIRLEIILIVRFTLHSWNGSKWSGPATLTVHSWRFGMKHNRECLHMHSLRWRQWKRWLVHTVDNVGMAHTKCIHSLRSNSLRWQINACSQSSKLKMMGGSCIAVHRSTPSQPSRPDLKLLQTTRADLKLSLTTRPDLKLLHTTSNCYRPFDPTQTVTDHSTLPQTVTASLCSHFKPQSHEDLDCRGRS